MANKPDTKQADATTQQGAAPVETPTRTEAPAPVAQPPAPQPVAAPPVPEPVAAPPATPPVVDAAAIEARILHKRLAKSNPNQGNY